MKRICSLLLVLVMMLSFCLVIDAETESAFSGTRLVVLEADSSDVENFIAGGRTALDLLLRNAMPDWVECKLSAKGRDLSLSVSFPFSSFEDYRTKNGVLLDGTPSIIYNETDGLFLMEGHEPTALLELLLGLLEDRGALKEREFFEIFELSENQLTLNGKDLFFDGPISILPAGKESRRFDNVLIDTVLNDLGTYTRMVTLTPDDTDEESLETLKEDLEDVGSLQDEETSYNTFVVKLTAANEEDLVSKTMQCLGVAVAVTETVELTESGKFSVVRDEYYDLESLLTDYGTFSYSFETPKFFENLTTEAEETRIYEGKITADTSLISYRYERGFRFDSVDVCTDFTQSLGKVSCSIRFVARREFAAAVHENLKESLTESLMDGAGMNIWDEDGNRIYEIHYSSWYVSDLCSFVQQVLGDGCSLEFEEGILPFGTSAATVDLSLSTLPGDSLPPERLTASFRFSDVEDASLKTRKLQQAVLEDGTLQISVPNGKRFSLEYSRLNFLKLAFWLIGLLVFGLLVFVLIRVLLLRKKKRDAERPAIEAPASEIPAQGNSVTSQPSVSSEASPVVQAPAIPMASEEPKGSFSDDDAIF